MVKVLHFVSTPAIWSGVMSVIMNYYRHMDRSEIQFDFLCFIPCVDSYEEEINGLGGRVFFIPKPHASMHSLWEIHAFFRAHQGEYSWFHNHEVYLSAMLKPIAAHYGIKGFIVHSHATQYSDHKLAAVRNRVLCMPIRFMGCHRFACSKAAGAFLFGKRAVRSGKVHILYNAIDTEKFRYDPQKRKEVREELGIAEGTFVIGHVGRFVPQKNHIFLLELFSRIVRFAPESRLLLIGDGPLLKEIQIYSFHKQLGEKILFLGNCLNVCQLLNAMDLFLLPSVYEGLPLSCVEAETNGLPCLISETISPEVQFVCQDMIKACTLDIVAWETECKILYRRIWEKGVLHKRQEASAQAQVLAAKAHFSIQKEAKKFQNFIISSS